MREADDWELKVGRATVGRDEDLEQRVEEARAVLAALLVADPSEIVLTPGVDAALALAGRLQRPRHRACLDASLAVGAVPTTRRRSMGADFICFACDRWLLGPEQTAAFWINPHAGSSALGVAPSVWAFANCRARIGAQRRLARDVRWPGLDLCAHCRASRSSCTQSLAAIPA